MNEIGKSARDAIDAIQSGYEQLGYVSDEQIATAFFLAQTLEKPLLVEGPPGVGKTYLAEQLAHHLAGASRENSANSEQRQVDDGGRHVST